MERVLTRNEQAYKNLMAVAKLLEAKDKNGIMYEVQDCYLDFGAGTLQTTIIAHDPNESGVLASYQAINPIQWKDITNAETIEQLLEIAHNIQ